MEFTRIVEVMESFFSWFGRQQVFGLPGNVLAHIFVGASLAVLMIQWKSWSPVKGMAVVLFLSIAKALLLDRHALEYNHLYSEFPKELFFSWLGFGTGWAGIACFRKMKDSA